MFHNQTTNHLIQGSNRRKNRLFLVFCVSVEMIIFCLRLVLISFLYKAKLHSHTDFYT